MNLNFHSLDNSNCAGGSDVIEIEMGVNFICFCGELVLACLLSIVTVISRRVWLLGDTLFLGLSVPTYVPNER